jgi:hypothetical protein
MIGELVLDSPTASAVVSNFISRAVEDGVLPSDFKV